ncbi:hypothetical protein BN7_951 [Wickerhamomyces ciferrii]|uniref:Arrestin C-terminal-like domain-containing protein n=1 Tax=Wickerhamomyces ciferrii (strain ATCC 14091 / BCRC 22168 / CBS 111 / JCM 3599 / NBRC 0793 / NRRL Y-1031 F-60-10) TaxID=1206466 RepID=K0K946_WICCF|nr:uncharacterized protein BN7_951 [Wickerhamomyces ciferrii]CCH41410.1 hypothetical protein BN7_951 [Wickerhamomyces ciferrii]
MIPYYKMLSGLSAELQLDEDVILLQGLNKRERNDAPLSLIRGSLKVMAKGRKRYIDKILIRFIGRSSDVIYKKSLNARYLRSQESKTIVQDVYEYGFNSNEPLKGSYSLPLLFVLDADLPESIITGFGNRTYCIEVIMEFEGLPKLMIRKPIHLMRGPLVGSHITSECIQALGDWREYMHYDLSISMKYISLGDRFNLNFQLRPLFNDRTSEIDQIKIFFIQKIQCEKRSEFIGDGDTHELNEKHLLKLINDPKELIKDSNLYNVELSIKLPKSMPFNIHPHISNNHLDDYLNPKSLKITHYIQMILKVKSIEKNSITYSNSIKDKSLSLSHDTEHQTSTTPISDQRLLDSSPFTSGHVFAPRPILKSDIYLRIPIYLLPSGKINQPSPPTYEEATNNSKSSKSKNNFNPLRLPRIKDTSYPPAYVI